MELSQEHFDNQISELTTRLDNMATKAELESIRKDMVTRDDIESVRTDMVTKADLISASESQTKEIENYTDSVATTIIEAVDNGSAGIERKLENRDKRMETVEKDVRQLKSALHLS